VQEATIASLSTLSFRVDKKPYSDHRVREAPVSAIDLDSLVKAVYQGTGTPTGALVPPTLWGHNTQVQPWPYDPAHAKALLTEAGYPNGFSVDLWAIPVARAYMPNGRRAAEMIQADWAKIGISAKIVSFEWGEYLRRVSPIRTNARNSTNRRSRSTTMISPACCSPTPKRTSVCATVYTVSKSTSSAANPSAA
jgi:dipeptide transport system substrate-binding protein